MATTQTTTKCGRCGRTLTAAKAVAEGYGRTCKARIAAAAKVAADQPAQVTKALELIADGGIVRATGALFLAMSSDGTVRYEVNPTAGSCSCKAGQYGRPCYHKLAATLVSMPTTAKATRTMPTPADPFAVFTTAA